MELCVIPYWAEVYSVPTIPRFQLVQEFISLTETGLSCNQDSCILTSTLFPQPPTHSRSVGPWEFMNLYLRFTIHGRGKQNLHLVQTFYADTNSNFEGSSKVKFITVVIVSRLEIRLNIGDKYYLRRLNSLNDPFIQSIGWTFILTE